MVKDEVGSPTYTLDLAKAVKVLLDIYFKKGLDYGVYNVTNSGKCSRLEFAEYITKSADLKTVFIPIVSSQSTRKAKRPQNSLLSNDKFISLTSHRLPSWQEAVRHYLEHSKNE
jgi:dTDP-4-dehydrorhamnose reductase